MTDAAAPVLTGRWNYPTTVLVGPGRVEKLAEACKALGMSKPLLITDSGLREAPITQRALKICRDGGLEVGQFADVKGNPTGENVEAGVRAFKQGGYDGVIAFGGGSGLDAAKAVALMVGQDRPLWDFEDVGDWWTRVKPEGMAPVVAVPTTSGTGSEVGRASVITDAATHDKKIIFHPKMMPATVIADPELTLGLPPHLTAATGVDAFIHCFEAYCAPGFHPMADGIALEGMRLIKDHLPQATRDGANLEARSRMLAASSMGAVAFQKGLGGVHAMAHPIGGAYDAHHGLINAILWPYVMVWNRPAIEDKMPRLAAALGLADRSFKGVLDWTLAFRRELAIPETLAALKVEESRADELGAKAQADPSNGGNPRLTTAADYAAILRKALKGDLT